MFEVFSTREIVGFIYVGIFIMYILCHEQTRKSTVKVIKCACKVKLIIPFVLMIIYTILLVLLFKRTVLWDVMYIKDIVMWVLFVGVPYSYNAVSKGNEEHYFRNLFMDNIKFIVLIEFFMGTFTFDFWIELILQAGIAFLTILQVVSGLKEENKRVQKLLDVILAIVGFVVFYHTIKAAMGAYTDVDPIELMVSFMIPIVLSVAFIPCAYLLALIAKYETVFMRMKFKEPKNKSVRIKRHLKIILVCGLLYKKLCLFDDEYIKYLYIRMEQKEFEEIVKRFNTTYKNNKKKRNAVK